MALATVPYKEPVAETPPVYRLLVVDDDINCANIMVWTLEMMGYTAQAAYDGPTAIALVRSFRPDVVLLDIGLPGMNGYEICQAMRMQPALKNTIFIAHTGWGQKVHKERSREAGFHYHLVKPLDIEAIKNILFVIEKGTL